MKLKVVMLVLLATGAAVADTVQLKSGSVIKGTAGLIQDGKLSFSSPELGDLKIAIENIVKLDPISEHVLLRPDDSQEKVPLEVKDGGLYVQGKSVDMANVKKTDPQFETWHGSINGAFNAARGNTYENSWAVFGDVSRRWEKDRLSADAGYYYSETGTFDGDDRKKTTDRWNIHGQHDHFWMPKFYGFEMARIERDMLKGLRARYELGIGPGYQWLDKDLYEATGKWTFNQQLALKWSKEELEDGDNVKKYGYAALSYQHHLGWITKWNEDLELFHNFRIDPEVDQWEKFLVRSDVGFSVKFIYDFTLIGKVEWDYESKVSKDRKNSDVRYIAGIGYKW